MSNIWQQLINLQNHLIEKFNDSGIEVEEPGMERFNQPGWVNRVWSSDTYRRAHLDVVDARDAKGLWMMHCCIFPHTHNPAPIFGFDVIAGKNKITGCFYDYSPGGDNDHPMLEYFAQESKKLVWHKQRKMPEWAEKIFSENIIAAGNVQDDTELEQIHTIATQGISYYLNTVGNTNNTVADTRNVQNFYSQNQKCNPHTPKVMISLGLKQDDVDLFINKCLFPEIN